MRWKITGQILGLLLIIIPVFYVSLFAFYLLLFSVWTRSPGQSNAGTGSDMVIQFEQHLHYEDGKFSVEEAEMAALQARGGWLQVLDESGQEVYQVGKPAGAPEHYTPAQLILNYRYSGAIKDEEHGYTIFVAMADHGERHFSYIIGLPDRELVRGVLYANPYTLIPDIFKVLGGALVTVTLVITVLAYFYGSRLAAPLAEIIEGIHRLAQPAAPGSRPAEQPYPETGLYASVFRSLNRLGKALQEHENERRRLESAREEWIANISHDVKTPLSSLKGFAELLADPDYQFSEGEVRRYAGIIQEKAAYMEGLVEDLRLTYQLKQAALPLQRSSADLAGLLRETVIDLLNDPCCAESPLTFEAVPEEVPYNGDRRLLQRAFVNLIANALVHNLPGTPVEVTIQGGEQVCVVIEDHGQGIAPGEVERLFERYYQGTHTGTLHKGSGLGMAIARQVIEAHGGRVEVNSVLGSGTRLEITLPHRGRLP